MKLNKITMMFAAAALASCSNDLNEQFAAQAPQDSRLIELDANFALAGVGAEDATTRTHWATETDAEGNTVLVNKFLPIYETAPDGSDKLSAFADLEAQAVGLCWLGQNGGENVYTNYQFYHFGWLAKDQEKAEFDKCTGDLTNGALYSEIPTKDVSSTVNPGDEADPANDFDVTNFPAKALDASSQDNLNYNSGIYKTDNKAIFGGDYIVYYPYNPEFKNAGTIPVVAQTQFGDGSTTSAPTTLDDPALGKATFRYSNIVNIAGGDQAAGFNMHNLSTLVRLKVGTTEEDPIAYTDEIDQIVLYSAKEQLLAKANLRADMIAAGKKGTELYAASEGAKTIVANFASADVLKGIEPTTPTTKSAYITVLPTEVEDLVVLVHNATQQKWATVNIGAKKFEAGKAAVLNLVVEKDDFESEFIAVDMASLKTAVTEASSATNPTIKVIGDITIANGGNIYQIYNPNLTITGDAIIVPEDEVLSLKCNVESDIRVLGKSCCSGSKGGRLLTWVGTTINKVTMEQTDAEVTTDAQYNLYNPMVTFSGATTIADGSAFDVQAGNVVVNKAVEQHEGNFNVAEDAKVTVNETGDLNFMGTTVVNDGTIEVMKGGHFDMTDKDGNATANDGKNMTNNGTFIHNVDAAVGTAVQAMNQEGEYRCRVDEQKKLDDAYLQWTACSVIEIVAKSTAADENYDLKNFKQHNSKHVDIEVNNTGKKVTFVDQTTADGLTIQIGNLTVKTALDIVYDAYTTTTSKRSLVVNGNCVSENAAITVKDIKDLTVTENLTVNDKDITVTEADKFTVEKDMTVNSANATFTKSTTGIVINGNLGVNGTGTQTFKYAKDNKQLKVTGDITVNKANFDASELDALNITCVNFSLENAAKATFGNRTSGDAKNMTVTGTISNPAGCTFTQTAATSPNLLAWITCTTLKVGGSFPGGKPKVVN